MLWGPAMQPSDSHVPPDRCRYYSSLRLPLMYSHPYSQITVETEFDNPIYETGVSLAAPIPPWGLSPWGSGGGMAPSLSEAPSSSGRQEGTEGVAGSGHGQHHFPGSKTTPGASLTTWEWGDYPEMQLLPSTVFFLLSGNKRI